MNTRPSYRRRSTIVIASACLAAVVFCRGFSMRQARAADATATALAPIDPQKVQDQDNMTWTDYKPIPGQNWSDPSKKASVRSLRIALIAIDFSDQDFVITKPKKSDLFGNPQIDSIKREDVPQFYADFWHKPSDMNHHQTMNGYWMEQSRGKYGITAIDAFGPYKMPHPLWYYGLNEHRQNQSTPDGSVAQGRMEPDCDALWRADQGQDIQQRGKNGEGRYDLLLRIYAGYDETGVWQEFGEMKFETRDDITPEFGNPNPEKPRWTPTRYEPWTSWAAGAQQWGLSSIRQGENSGTIMHEIAHAFFSVGDNNNNPYAEPYRRVGSGPWDMMDRGSFNGPGGPHMRWVVPVLQGGSMPAGLMLRQKLNFGFLAPDGAPAQIQRRNRGGRGAAGAPAEVTLPLTPKVLFLNREGLAKSGLAVAEVSPRAVEPLPGTLAGVMVCFDGDAPQDRTPPDDATTNPLSSGIPNYNDYTVEVVQRIGYDSFCPDSGVLLAKNKYGEGQTGGRNGFNCFNFVIDAHPEDINVVDFKRPKTGTPVMRTIADFRQLNDALFHAGTNSGSKDEWEDTPNRLHFYVVDMKKNAEGVLSYVVGVRSLDGSGPQKRDVKLAAPAGASLAVSQLNTKSEFTLTNTGQAADTDPALHPQDERAFLNSDIYRITVAAQGNGWTAQLQNQFAAIKFGEFQKVPVFVSHAAGAAATGTITLKAVSESDPSKVATATLTVSAN